MADEKKEKKQHDKDHKIYKAGDRYVCGECGAEVTFEVPSCPTCKLHLNWSDIEGNIRRG